MAPTHLTTIERQQTELEKWLREQIATDREILSKFDPVDDCSDDLEVSMETGYPCNPYLAIHSSRAADECDAKECMLDRLAWCDRHWADGIRQIIALPYRNRPGYKPEWALDEIARGAIARGWTQRGLTR